MDRNEFDQSSRVSWGEREFFSSFVWRKRSFRLRNKSCVNELDTHIGLLFISLRLEWLPKRGHPSYFIRVETQLFAKASEIGPRCEYGGGGMAAIGRRCDSSFVTLSFSMRICFEDFRALQISRSLLQLYEQLQRQGDWQSLMDILPPVHSDFSNGSLADLAKQSSGWMARARENISLAYSYYFFRCESFYLTSKTVDTHQRKRWRQRVIFSCGTPTVASSDPAEERLYNEFYAESLSRCCEIN